MLNYADLSVLIKELLYMSKTEFILNYVNVPQYEDKSGLAHL